LARKNKLKRSSSLDRSEGDGDHARDHLQQGKIAATASPDRDRSSDNNRSASETQRSKSNSSNEGLQRRNSDERRSSHRSSFRKQSSSSKKSEPTEQQIAEYAGKRALMRLEQEFADSAAHNNGNTGHEYYRSVMDRRKLARVPQVNKQDLIIGEYLGRGNFCDVFEVKWILEDKRYSRARECTGSARQFSSSVQSADSLPTSESGHSLGSLESSNSVDDLESNMENLSLHASNDLSLLSDERGGAPRLRPRTRRSISQVNVLQNSRSIRASRDPNVLALKCLRPAVRAQPRKFVIGAEDLAHETALLACLDHPNIISLYGRAQGCFSKAFQMRPKSVENNYDLNQEGEGKKVSNEGYFIILDRLMATLTGRIDEWMDECRSINGAEPMAADDYPPSQHEVVTKMPLEKNLREHLYKRLKVAYCIADALEYLHSRHVVFRDLKPANVGFDCNDCVKMFDFGFATSIAPLLNQEYQGYGPLTETCGTRRYMAPEVALKLGYGKEVDVYSFGMLLWEICVLEKPFDSIQSVEEFHDLVVLCGKRPSLHIDPLWTPSLKHLMSRCWSTDPLDRPTMVQVKSMLCNVLRDMNMNAMQKKGGGSGTGSSGRQQESQQQQQQHNFMSKLRRRVSL
jgi:serine/threonine protein kinase